MSFGVGCKSRKWQRHLIALSAFLKLFVLAGCSFDEPKENLPVGLAFGGVERVEPAAGGMWRVVWAPLVAVQDPFYAVFEREESGGSFNFANPIARTKQQFLLTGDLRLLGSRCYTVRAIVKDQVIPSRDNQVCTGHKPFSFAGLKELKPLEKGNYLLSWPLTPFDGDDMSFEVSERRKGESVWNTAGSTAESFFPTRLISIDEVVCFNVRYLHNGLPKDTNNREICTDEESTGNFVGIKSIKKAAANDPLGGYLIEWERSVREDVVAYRVYMGADFKKVVGETSGTESQFRVKGLTVGATYEFGVRLFTKGGREDANLKKLRVTIENDVPVVTAVDLRGVRRIDAATGESKVNSIRCTGDFVDPDRSSGRIFPKVEFKARLAAGERPIVLRQRQVLAPVKLDDRGRGTVSSEYIIDPAKDRRGNDLFCEVTVFDGLDPSATVPSQFVFLPDSPGIATGIFISKQIYFDPREGSTHYYGPEVGGEPAQVLSKPDGTKANHSCMVSGPEGNVQNTETLDICEDTTIDIIIKRVRVPEELARAGREAELAAFESKMVYSEGGLGDNYNAFIADLSNRAKLGYWDPDAGDLASAIEFRHKDQVMKYDATKNEPVPAYNGTVVSARCLEGVCEVKFQLAPNFASGSAFGELGPDGNRLVHAQFEYRVRTYDPGALEGFDINGTPVDEIGWSNWAVAKIEVTGVDEQPRNTGITVLGEEDRVQKVIFCNDMNSNPECAEGKDIKLNPESTDPMLKYMSGKGFGYFDLEDDPPVRVLTQSAVDSSAGEWVKPKAGIASPDPFNRDHWEAVPVALNAATACNQLNEFCPFKCSKTAKNCVGYFRPALDRTATINVLYDVWVEIDLAKNPDAQYFGKPDAEREVKSLESGMLSLQISPLNDKADTPDITTTTWQEDEADSVQHQIKFVPTTGYVAATQGPNEVQYYDPDGDLLRRATDIEVRFWDGGQLKTSYCKTSADEATFSGAGSTVRPDANYPGVRGVTAANCQMDIGKVVYRPVPPHVDAGKTEGIEYNAKMQWVCDGSGNCAGNLLLPENYNSLLGNKPIEFDYRIRATRPVGRQTPAINLPLSTLASPNGYNFSHNFNQSLSSLGFKVFSVTLGRYLTDPERARNFDITATTPADKNSVTIKRLGNRLDSKTSSGADETFSGDVIVTVFDSQTTEVKKDDWTDWKPVSLKVNPVADEPMALTISLGGEDSNRAAINEDTNFTIRLVRGVGVARNVTVTGATPPAQRHYDVYFDVDETDDVAYEVSVVDIYKKDGVPVIFKADGTDISASLPANNIFVCDADGVCSGEFKAAPNFFSPAGQDAYFKVTVKTHPRDPSKRAGQAKASDPNLPGQVSFTVAAIDDAPSTGGSGIMSGIPEDETYPVIFKKNPAADEFGYTEIEAGDLAEKVEFAYITYYDPFYQDNQTLTPNAFPDPTRLKNGEVLSFLYGPGASLSGVHGYPRSRDASDPLPSGIPAATAINRSSGRSRQLIVRGEYFATAGGQSPTLVPDNNLGNYLLPATGDLPERYQFACRRFSDSGMLAGQCKVEIRSPLHFNTDSPHMSGRSASMSYRIYTRDPNRWKEPYPSGQMRPVAGDTDETNGKWSDWKPVELLFSPVNDAPTLWAPFKNEELTWEKDLNGPGNGGPNLQGGLAGNNSAANPVIGVEDTWNKVIFRWLQAYSDVDYNTESFTYRFDRATLSGVFTPGSFSNARRFLATKLAVNTDKMTTAFWQKGQQSVAAELWTWGEVKSISRDNPKWSDSKEMLANGNSYLRARSFMSDLRSSPELVLPVGQSYDFVHNLNKPLSEINFSVVSASKGGALSSLEVQSNFSLTEVSQDVLRVTRTGNSLEPSGTFSDTMTLRASAAGWIAGNKGAFLGPVASNATVSSATNINCEDSSGDCIFNFLPPPDFFGDIEATVRIADGNTFPMNTDWSPETNAQKIFIKVENKDDLPEIIVPEAVFDVFEGETALMNFARLSNGSASCSVYEAGEGNTVSTGGGATQAVYRAAAKFANPWSAPCEAVQIPEGYQDAWQTDPGVYPAQGCQVLGDANTVLPVGPRGPGSSFPIPEPTNPGACLLQTFFYTFKDADRHELTGIEITGIHQDTQRFSLYRYPASSGDPNRTGTPLGVGRYTFGGVGLGWKALRVHTEPGSANGTYRFGQTSGRPFDYSPGDPALGDAYFTYRVKTNDETADETNTINCADIANCWSNEGRVYVRIHNKDNFARALNNVPVTVNGQGFNVAGQVSADENAQVIQIDVTPAMYQDPDPVAAPYDKAIGIKLCQEEYVDKKNTGGGYGYEVWEDYDNGMFEWSPDFEYREETQELLQGTMADPKMNQRSYLKFESFEPEKLGSASFTKTLVSKGSLQKNAGIPIAFAPATFLEAPGQTSLTENNGLTSSCTLSGGEPTGNCSMQLRPMPYQNGEYVVCVHVRSYAKQGAKVSRGFQWSEPIYFKVTVNPVDTPPRIGQLPVRARGNEDHTVMVEVRPNKFDWLSFNQGDLTKPDLGNSGIDKLANRVAKHPTAGVLPGYYDFDSVMGSGSADLAEYLYVNMAAIPGVDGSGIGNGAIAHAADPDAASPSFDLPCVANSPANNICKIKCKANGFCSFKFTPPVNNDSDFRLEYWVQSVGGKKLSSRSVDNARTASGRDASYAPYENLGIYDNYFYMQCLSDTDYKLDMWRYALEEPRLPGNFGDGALYPVLEYGAGIPYYDQKNPPLATRQLPSFLGYGNRNIVPMRATGVLSSFDITFDQSGRMSWPGPGISENQEQVSASWNPVPVWSGRVGGGPTQAEVIDYMTNKIVYAQLITQVDGSPESLRDLGATNFVSASVSPRGAKGYGTPLSFLGLGPSFVRSYSLQNITFNHYARPQGPPVGPLPVAVGQVGATGCSQQQTGLIKIEFEPVADKPTTPTSISRTISGRLTNEIHIGNLTSDATKDGYSDGDGDGIVRFTFLGASPANPQWSITTSPTPPASPVGLTLLQREDHPNGVRYHVNLVGSNASGPQGCNSGAGFCKFYFHPANGFAGNVSFNYSVTTGVDAWDSDDGVNPAFCAGAAFGKTCTENPPGVLNLTVISNQPTITLPTGGQPFEVNEDAFAQPLRLNGTLTQAQFNVDEGGGPEQDPERVVVWFSGCDESIVKCSNIVYSRTDAAYGSTVSPANNLGAANGTINVTPEPNRFTTSPMSIVMHAEEYDAAGNGTGYEATRTIQISVLPVEDQPTISSAPVTSPAYVANEDEPIVITGVVVDEGGGVDEDGQRLVVSFTSSDQSLVPNANIVLAPADEAVGSAAGNAGDTGRTITVTPAANANTPVGGIKITMSVSDGVSAPATREFYVQFNTVNDPPVLTSAEPRVGGAGGNYQAAQWSPFNISGITIDEGGNPTGAFNEDANVVTVQFISSDSSVINPANSGEVVLSGPVDSGGADFNATARSLTVTPSGFGNNVVLTMRVSDGTTTVNFPIHFDVAKPPLGPLDCTDSTEANPDNFVIGSGQPVPAITCSGLFAASAPGSGTATYELASNSTCNNVTISSNSAGAAPPSMTLGGTMSTLGDCTVVVSGNDQSAASVKVPLAQRKQLNFQIAKVDDLVFSNPTLSQSCALSIDLATSYYLGRSSYASAAIAAGAGNTGAFGSLAVSASKVTGSLVDFSKTFDSFDVTVTDSKGTARTETLGINITKTPLTSLSAANPSATVLGSFEAGKQAWASYGTTCVNSATCESAAPALVAAGATHTCGLDAAGVLHCWGENDTKGKLGIGSNVASDELVPLNIETGTPAAANTRVLAVGKNHSCLVTSAGKLLCWGDNSEEQLATPFGTAASFNAPTEIVSAAVASVAVGHLHTCYLKTDGKVYCAGRNDKGQLGNGTFVDSASWVDTGLSNAVAIAAAGDNSCALTGNTGARSIHCWGDNTTFQLGSSTAGVSSNIPVAVDAIAPLNRTKSVSLAMGGDTAKGQVCVITSDGGVTDSGTLRCFGNNASGQLGHNPTTISTTGGGALSALSPTITGNPALVAVAMGASHTCVLSSARKLYCFGEQGGGRLGNANTTGATVFTPAEVTTLTSAGVVAVSAGAEHTCAVTANGRMHCFGLGANGRLGKTASTANLGTPYDLNGNSTAFGAAVRSCERFALSLVP